MCEKLNNSVAIITGSYGGIGNAIAENFISHDIKIALFGRNKEKLNSQKSKLEKVGGKDIIATSFDIKDNQNFKSAVEEVFDQWGKIDILINNAGITNDNIVIRMKDSEWDNVINTNLKATFMGCKFVSKYMIKQKYGKIINISSIIGQIGNKGQSNYAASKAGIDALTKSLSKELGSRGINVNSISPGYIETEMTNNLPDTIKEDIINNIPLNRFGKPSDVASLVNFLISKNASYITGQIINLDGGMVTQ